MVKIFASQLKFDRVIAKFWSPVFLDTLYICQARCFSCSPLNSVGADVGI